jgi:c-di-GMP-binding flagellar brake protein YcgR
MQRDSIDRRRSLRVNFPFTIHLFIPQALAVSAYTEDISEGGVKVTIKEKLDINSFTDLEIFVKEVPIKCVGKVVWIEERESDLIEGEIFFDIGIKFQEISQEDSRIIGQHVQAVQKIK